MSSNRFPRSGDLIKNGESTYRVTMSDLTKKKVYCAMGEKYDWTELNWNGDYWTPNKGKDNETANGNR